MERTKRKTMRHKGEAKLPTGFVILFIIMCGLLLDTSVLSDDQIKNDREVSPQSVLSDKELKIWNNPVFKQQFIDSYMAETEIEPRVTADERDRMLKVLELISSDKMGEAAAMLQKNRNKAVSAVFDFTLANIYFQQEDYEQAVTAYQTAVEKHPKFRRAWRNLALIYIRQNEYEKALPALTRVIELGGNDAITYGLLGFAYSSVENNIPAESAYRMAILLDPSTIDWKMGLARSFFKQERFAEASALCGQLIKDYPDRTDIWLLQANAYIGQNQPLRAAEIFELVNHIGKSTTDSLMTLGNIYINEEMYEMATDAYIEAMEKDSEYKPARAVHSAKVLIARGAFTETRRLIEYIEGRFGEKIEMDTRKDILKLRARLAVADGSGNDEEVRVLEEIVALDPLDGEALILLGQHCGRTGDVEKAIFYFERAASIENYEADAKVRHAQLLVQKGKYDEALPLLRRAQQLKARENVQEYLEQVERIAKTR
ncbi:MAG: tetratricopeptide repeat protein [Sedimentisphaerales bacterium]|nr:tetratricopeptide repeat protein [Sedimentisphaerales bacterium]